MHQPDRFGLARTAPERIIELPRAEADGADTEAGVTKQAMLHASNALPQCDGPGDPGRYLLPGVAGT